MKQEQDNSSPGNRGNCQTFLTLSCY